MREFGNTILKEETGNYQNRDAELIGIIVMNIASCDSW